MATELDNADVEHFHDHREFYGSGLLWNYIGGLTGTGVVGFFPETPNIGIFLPLSTMAAQDAFTAYFLQPPALEHSLHPS